MSPTLAYAEYYIGRIAGFGLTDESIALNSIVNEARAEIERLKRFWREQCDLREQALKSCEAEQSAIRAKLEALPRALLPYIDDNECLPHIELATKAHFAETK